MKKKVLVLMMMMLVITTNFAFATDSVTVGSNAPTDWDSIMAIAFVWFGRLYNGLVAFVLFKGIKRVVSLVGEFQDQESDDQGSKHQKKIMSRIAITMSLVILTPLFKFFIVDIAKDMGITMSLVW